MSRSVAETTCQATGLNTLITMQLWAADLRALTEYRAASSSSGQPRPKCSEKAWLHWEKCFRDLAMDLDTSRLGMAV